MTDDEYKALKAATARRKKAAQKVIDACNDEVEEVRSRWATRVQRANEKLYHVWDAETRLRDYETEKAMKALAFKVGDIAVDEFGNKYRVESIWPASKERGRVRIYVVKLNKDGSPSQRELAGSITWKKWEPED